MDRDTPGTGWMTKPRIDRRGYLGLAAAGTAFGGAGWLSRWIGTPAREADRSFARRAVWRDTLPTGDWEQTNHLQLYHDSFEDGSSAIEQWRRDLDGSEPHVVEAGDGRLRIRNPGAGRVTETLATPVEIAAPWVAVAATVTTAGDGQNLSVGFAKDVDNTVRAGIGPDGPEVGYRFAGREAAIRETGHTPSPPYELMGILMGDRLAVLTRETGEPWDYQGHVGWRSRSGGVDLFDRREWRRWNPAVSIETDDTGHAMLSDFRVFHTLQFGVRDPTVVTYPDGSPLVQDGELYLTATCGSIDHRGYQVVLGLDLETYDVTMHAALWAESVAGYISNYVAGHLMYDPDRDEFRLCWSGFGNGRREPSWNQKCWVSRTQENLLSGTHVVDCELMHLPWGLTGRQHDPFVIRDEDAGVWRCVHNSDAIHRVTVSETTDDSWTGGWTPVASYRDLLHQIEGGKLARINGEIVLSYADEGSPNHMAIAAYPDPSADRRWIDVDHPPGDVAPHPSLVAVPAERGSKLLLITMDGETVFGLGEPTHGALVIYEEAGGTPR